MYLVRTSVSEGSCRGIKDLAKGANLDRVCAAMTEKIGNRDIISDSANAFADLGFDDAVVTHLKSRLGTQIARTLDRRKLSVRAAAQSTGFDAADISRIKRRDFGRFTLDRLVRIAVRLGCRVSMAIRVSEGNT